MDASTSAAPSTNKPGVEVHWQSETRTLADFAAHICLSELGADVFFQPLLKNGEVVDKPKRISAHKVFLMRSPVFGKMFFYDGANGLIIKNDGGIQVIELPDVEEEALEAFLTFLYTDKVELTAENVMSILYIANKYDVAPLIERCLAFVLANVSVENAFEVLTFAVAGKHGHEAIGKKCFETACEHAQEAVKTLGFYGIDLDTLCEFVRKDELAIDEYDLFEAMYAWALKKLERENGDENGLLAQERGKDIRRVLGPALFSVRFPCIDLDVIREKIVPLKVLTDSELIQVFTIATSKGRAVDNGECPFPTTLRPYGFFFEFLFNNFSNSRQTQSMSKTVGGVLWHATVNSYTSAADCFPHHHSLSATVSCSTADPVVAVVTVLLKAWEQSNINNIVGRAQQRNHTFSSNENNIVIKCYVRRPINVVKNRGYLAEDGSARVVVRIRPYKAKA